MKEPWPQVRSCKQVFSKKAIVHTFATVMDYHVFSVWAWIKVKFWLFEPHLFLLILL